MSPHNDNTNNIEESNNEIIENPPNGATKENSCGASFLISSLQNVSASHHSRGPKKEEKKTTTSSSSSVDTSNNNTSSNCSSLDDNEEEEKKIDDHDQADSTRSNTGENDNNNVISSMNKCLDSSFFSDSNENSPSAKKLQNNGDCEKTNANNATTATRRISSSEETTPSAVAITPSTRSSDASINPLKINELVDDKQGNVHNDNLINKKVNSSTDNKEESNSYCDVDNNNSSNNNTNISVLGPLCSFNNHYNSSAEDNNALHHVVGSGVEINCDKIDKSNYAMSEITSLGSSGDNAEQQEGNDIFDSNAMNNNSSSSARRRRSSIFQSPIMSSSTGTRQRRSSSITAKTSNRVSFPTHDINNNENGSEENSKSTISTGGTRRRRSTFRGRRRSMVEGSSAYTGDDGDFAVKSIVRGSQQWKNMIKPFVSDLAFRSLVNRRSESDVCFQSYTCEAAVLFVDLSGYSKITSMIAHRGAHALSAAVNAYLERILTIINRYGGDVVKFAGDAVLVVWEGQEGDDDELEYNLLCAAKCALELQQKAGTHEVGFLQSQGGRAAPTTPLGGIIKKISSNENIMGLANENGAGADSLKFHIHIGLTCGILESEIFAAPSHLHMQRLYHSVSGPCLVDLSELVDIAKAGQIAISEKVLDYIETRIMYEEIEDYVGAYLLQNIELDNSLCEAMEQHIEDIVRDRHSHRNTNVEEEFIHPKVLQILSHGGLSPTQIAQIRNLCVLFIGKTSSGSSVNWLLEVQSILDKHRCPMVQILDDDKGVHVVAAVNLYESVPESSILGLDACRELVQKKLGCAIGVALGSTFCGVTGLNSVACRWDITGPPPVRAARLMEYALENDIEVAIDSSLFNDPMAASRMALYSPNIQLKGSSVPCPVYRLSGSKLYSIFRVLETMNGTENNNLKAVQQARKYINTHRSRCAVFVTGLPCSGKKFVCQRAASLAGLVPYVHVCDETAGLAQLARSIATWYSYVDNIEVHTLSRAVIDHMDNSRWSRAHDDCVALVNSAINNGLKACFVIDRIHFLDSFSLSILRESLQKDEKTGVQVGKKRRSTTIRRRSSNNASVSFHGSDSDCEMKGWDERSYHTDLVRERAKGKVIFFGTHTSLYHFKSAKDIVNDITRSSRTIRVRIVEVGEATMEEQRAAVKDSTDMDVEDRWLRCYGEATGNCIGYLNRRSASIRHLSDKIRGTDPNDVSVRHLLARKSTESTLTNSTSTYEEIGRDLVLHIPPGFVRKNRQLPVNQVSASIAMQISQLYDGLPPIFQTFTKILAVATRRALFKLPKVVGYDVLNDLVAEGVDSKRFTTIIEEMKDMYLLKEELDDGIEKFAFQNPALADTALDVCTPNQITCISEALSVRLEPFLDHNFKVPLVMASLYHDLGREDEAIIELWRTGYSFFHLESEGWPESEKLWWKECILDCITATGHDPEEVVDEDPTISSLFKPVVPLHVRLIKSYVAPISFGPISSTIAVIGRSLLHEFGAHVRCDYELIDQLRVSLESACHRYLKQVTLLERFLIEELGLSRLAEEQLKNEVNVIDYLSMPSDDSNEVHDKIKKFIKDFVGDCVKPRIERLHTAVVQVRKMENSRDQKAPAFIMNSGQRAIKYAYCKLRQDNRCWKDLTEDALMVMATRHWTPKLVPSCEILPQRYYHTICRIRSEVLKQVGTTSKCETSSIRHRHTFEDFEAFLITSMILEDES